MRTAPYEGDQAALLLRVGLGAVWVCEGLLANLLAPDPLLLLFLPWSHSAPEAAATWVRLSGAGEILLGLLLIRGWLIRPLALLQSALLLVLSLRASVLVPGFLRDPTGPVAEDGVLVLAGVCLLLLIGGRGAAPSESWKLRAVPLLLRLGLAGLWIYQGLVLKWLLRSQAGLLMVARTGMIPGHVTRFLALLGGLEVVLGAAVLAGLWVRELAVLQVALLTIFSTIVGWTSPAYLSDPLGGLVENVGAIGCALALYSTGGGALALDGWLARSARARRWGFRLALHGCYAASAAAAAIYGLQRHAAATPTLAELFHKLELDETSQAEDLASLLRREGGWRFPLAVPVCGLAWVLGGLTVLAGSRAMLHLDLWIEGRAGSLHTRAVDRLPAEEGLVGRALLAIGGREAQHRRLLRDHLEALRRASGGSR